MVFPRRCLRRKGNLKLWAEMDGEYLGWDSISMRYGLVDGCGMNPHYSATHCTAVPKPHEPDYYIPNAVVAGDADNGLFLPVVMGLMGDLYELTIYDRKGMQMFHTSNPDEGWRPGSDTPQGAYTYSLRVRYNDNRIKTHTGTVLVLKSISSFVITIF